MQLIKRVGQPCPDCGTPFIQGPKGIFCKPCYIRWKNQNQPEQSYSGQVAQTQQRVEPYKEVMDYKSDKISEAQDRKELAIAIAGAKAGAGLIVTALVQSGAIIGNVWQEEFEKAANFIYNFTPTMKPPFN